MPVLSIKASVECEGCGGQFRVELDAADDRPKDWTWFDLVKDTVRGGNSCENLEGGAILGFSSVQADLMLCPECTRKVDEFVPEDRDASAEEVKEAIGA